MSNTNEDERCDHEPEDGFDWLGRLFCGWILLCAIAVIVFALWCLFTLVAVACRGEPWAQALAAGLLLIVFVVALREQH